MFSIDIIIIYNASYKFIIFSSDKINVWFFLKNLFFISSYK